MFTFLISLIAAIAVGVVCAKFILSSVVGSVFIGILVFFVLVILISRSVGKKVQAIMQEAQLEMKELAKIQSPETRKRLMPKIMDKAIDIFKKAYKYQHFQPMLAQNINGQIGSIYYIQKRFDDAEPYLAKTFMLNGSAIVMHACILYRKKDYKAMKDEFERAVKFSPKQPLLWNVYAWCLMKSDSNVDGAIEVLNRSLVFTRNNEITKTNLDLLKNKGTMKMAEFGEEWYQFLLEEPTAQELQKLAQLQKEAQMQMSKMGSPFAKHMRRH
ncbi:MAG: hypothetical protein II180_00120 [Proteobacteria bacterium]|nr:hypothetical protein [Pseudomonadota bacterium]